jgi:type IV secretory pathway TraG/TraD family ATPase VirD4
VTGTIAGGTNTEHPETVWVVAAGGAALALGCLFIAAGAISAAIFGNGLALPHSAQFGTIIRGTLTDPSHPAAAWPAPLNTRLPGPIPYWATFAILVAVLGTATAKAWAKFGGHGSGASRSGFARPGQLRRSASPAAAQRRRSQTRPSLVGRRRVAALECGYPLGRAQHGGIPLRPSWEASLRLIAPPGEGKTFRVLARICRQHPGAVVATSTKPDLYELTATARARIGPVAALDPDGLVPAAAPIRWSPVAGCESSQVAERRAAALVAAVGDDNDTRHGAFFRSSARDVLKCYLHAAALDGKDIRSVLEWSRRLDDPTAAEILRGHESAAPGWAGIIAVHTTEAGETTSGVMRHLAQALSCFSHEAVIALCCPRRSQAFDIAEFLKANGTVYLLGKEASLGAMAPLITAFAQEVFDTAERIAVTRPGRRLDPPLLGLLDEAPSIAPIPTLPALLANGRGLGIVIVYAMQSFSQAVSRWGTQQAATMGNATSITAVFGGLTEVKDLADLERLCGQRRVKRHSTHRGGEKRGTSVSISWEREAVLPLDSIRTLPDGVALVLWGKLPPILAALPLLSEDRDWKAIRAEEAALRAANDGARRHI